MIISINWLKDIINYTLTPKELEDGLTSLGLECTYKTTNTSYSDIIIGKILSISKIENSDHLNLCSVDIGNAKKNIVCGANNVKVGILVPVALPGSTLDYGNFQIKKAKIRGVVSNGMICSEKELGISDNHEGIMILDSTCKIGQPFQNLIENDLLDIDLTPNRGDCFSHLGVAREVSILDNKKINKTKRTLSLSNQNSNIKIDIMDETECPRYAARVIRGIKVAPSPDWLKEKIESIGQKSINNIVDAANYILFDLGHPMHTFDLNKINNSTIIVKKANKDQKLLCLDGVERKISKNHLLICDSKKPLAIAGIMGLQESAVTESTTDILIESAYFNPVTIRKGAKLLDLSTEASKRFERDTDIDNVIYSLETLSALIQEIGGGEVSQDLIDIYPIKKEKNKINFSINDCNALLGTDVDTKEASSILKKLSIETKTNKNKIECLIPRYRNDLERPVDLYEEVARVYGYDNIPSIDTLTSSFSAMSTDKKKINKNLSNILSMNGFNEHYSNSLLSEKEIALFSKNMDVEIDNPLSSDMQYLRNSIIPGLIKAVSFNMNHGNKNFKLFELGEVHKKIEVKGSNKYIQNSVLGLSWCCLGNKNWKDKTVFDIFDVKGEISYIFNLLGLLIDFKYDNKLLSILHNKKKIGYITTIQDIDSKLLKNNPNVFFSELYIDEINNILSNKKITILMPSQFPSIERDISILVSKDFSYKEISKLIYASGGNLLKDVSLFDLYIDSSIDDNKHSLSISLLFSSNERTLKDDEVDDLMKKIIKDLKSKFKIIQR